MLWVQDSNQHIQNRQNYASMRVKWEDQQSAFNNCIRTGIVIKLQYKDVKEFLADAQKW